MYRRSLEACEGQHEVGAVGAASALLKVCVRERFLPLLRQEGAVPEDLRREAAHNLVQIYRRSGNLLLARNIMAKYLTI